MLTDLMDTRPGIHVLAIRNPSSSILQGGEDEFLAVLEQKLPIVKQD
jgi:hypothetical protein